MANNWRKEVEKGLDRLAREAQVEMVALLERTLQKGKLRGLPEDRLRETEYSVVANAFYNFVANTIYQLREEDELHHFVSIYATVRGRMEETRNALLLELAGWDEAAAQASENDGMFPEEERGIPKA